jgi:hypothetical protein
MNKLILVLTLVMFGCANTQILEQSKQEKEYRRQILEMSDRENAYQPKNNGPIEMPKEWMDQWRDKPIDKNQK